MSDLGRFFTGVVGYAVGVYTGNWTLFASALVGERQAQINRDRERRARDAYNAALVGRLQQSTAQPAAARRLVLGKTRHGGQALRPPFSHGTNSEKLTMVLEFAGHEITEFTQFYADDTPLELDEDGWVLTAPWMKTRNTAQGFSGTLNGSGGATVILTTATSITPSALWHGATLADFGGTLTVSMVGTTVTLSGGPPGANYALLAAVPVAMPLLRIRPYLGTATQSVGGDLAAEYPGNMRATDHYRGIALAVVDFIYDQDVFTAGPPQISAQISGAVVYDPRLDTTAGGSGAHREDDPDTWEFSENPALLARFYALHANGLGLTAADLRLADTVADADVCDVATEFTLRAAGGATSTVDLPRYRCGYVVPTDGSPRQAFEEILESMAGRWGWGGGLLRMRAGAMRAAVDTIDQGWIWQRVEDGQASAEPYVRIINGVPRENKLNAVSGTCVDPSQRWQALPFPAVRDAVLIAAEGEYPGEVELGAVNHIAHAQHLASIAIRESQAALRMEAQCALSAYRLELFDVASVDLPRYGMVAKTMEVTGWRWHPEEGVSLRLAEITEAIFEPVAELVGRDPAPNSNLPRPWDVEAITGLAVTSGSAPLADGSIIARLEVTWDAATSNAIRNGGQIEVQYAALTAALPDGDGWPSWMEAGGSTRAVIPGVQAATPYLVRARCVQLVPYVRGDWAYTVAHVTATVPLVGTDGIEPEAATEIVELKTVYSDVVYGTGLQVVAGAAITPPVDARVVVVANFDASGVVGFESTRWAALFIDEMANVTVGTEVDYSDAGISAGTCLFGDAASVGTARTKCSVTFTFDAAAGVPYLVGLATSNSVAFSTGLTFYGRPRLQVQIIKR